MKPLTPREYCIDQCVSSDFFLFLLMIIVEQAKEYDQADGISLDTFTKNEKWDLETLREEYNIATDHLHEVNDLILWQVLFFIEQFQLGKIEAVEIDDEETASEEFIKKIITKNHKELNSIELERTAQIYLMALHRLLTSKEDIKKRKEISLKNDIQNFNDGRVTLSRGLDFDFYQLQPTAQVLPEHIYIKCKFDEDKVDELVAELYNHLFNFEDDSIDRGSYFDAEEAEASFEQDLEEFYGFIAEQEKTFNTVSIPFSLVSKNGFNLIKILFYLIMDDAIEVNWSSENSIKVKLLKPTNIGVKSILTETEKEKERLKSDLSYDETTSVLKIGNSSIKITGNEQKVFLKIILKNKNRFKDTWFFSEVAEIYDGSASIDDKKFYNIAYNLNKRVASDTEYKQLFILTKQTIQVNPKYLSS